MFWTSASFLGVSFFFFQGLSRSVGSGAESGISCLAKWREDVFWSAGSVFLGGSGNMSAHLPPAKTVRLLWLPGLAPRRLEALSSWIWWIWSYSPSGISSASAGLWFFLHHGKPSCSKLLSTCLERQFEMLWRLVLGEFADVDQSPGNVGFTSKKPFWNGLPQGCRVVIFSKGIFFTLLICSHQKTEARYGPDPVLVHWLEALVVGCPGFFFL